MNQDDNNQRIDDYLLGRMKSGERSAFERSIDQDESLAEDIAASRMALDALELAEDQALKVRLQQLEAKLSGSSAPAATSTPAAPESATVVALPGRSRGRWLGVAAALLLMLLAGWFVVNGIGNRPEQLAMTYFEPFPNYATTNVRGDQTEDATMAAFNAYDAADFARAVELFRSLEATDVNRFYLAQSLFAAKEFTAAAPLFSDLAARADFALAPEAVYYAALTDLARGQTTEATKSLETISADPDHPFREQAAALLAELN